MTTATAQAPVTEAEIRKALADRAKFTASGGTTPQEGETLLRAALRGIAEDYAQAINDAAFATLDATAHDWGDLSTSDGPWRDLRPSEAYHLRALTNDAIATAVDRAEAAIFEELTTAALRFAELHPDAPRAVRK